MRFDWAVNRRGDEVEYKLGLGGIDTMGSMLSVGWILQRFRGILDAMPVYGDDRDRVPEVERVAIARLCREMDSLGCEVKSVCRESGAVERWHVQWRVKDRRINGTTYGATGGTALAAARAALSNAQSDLGETVSFDHLTSSPGDTRCAGNRPVRVYGGRTHHRPFVEKELM